MTMYITVATHQRVIQVSDRRITWFENGKPKSKDDSTNKAVIVNGPKGHFSIVYSGLAEVRKIKTPDIMAQIFSKINLNSPSPKILFDTFIDRLSDKFRNTGIPTKYQNILKTEIYIAGFLYTGALFYLRISNYKDKKGNDVGLHNFNYYVRAYPPPSEKDKLKGAYIEIGGISDRHAKRILRGNLIKLRQSNFFYSAEGEEVAIKLVNIIRNFAKTSLSENLVGVNCMATILNAPRATDHSFRYYDEGKAPIQYGPLFVINGGIISNFESGPL